MAGAFQYSITSFRHLLKILHAKKCRPLQRQLYGKTASDFPTTHFYSGWTAATVLTKGIEKAFKDVGYANLNPEAVLEALKNYGEMDTGTLGKITIKPDKTQLSYRLKMWQFQQGDMVLAYDWFDVPDTHTYAP